MNNMIYELEHLKPKIAPDAFIAPDATVIGDVTIGPGSSIWFGCLVRGDVHYVKIGSNVNIQDLSVLHVTGGKCPLNIGDNCSMGHRVLLHGCTLRDWAFVGMGAIVMDDAEIEPYGFLAAGSLLPPGKKIPTRMLAVGSPAKVVREVSPEEIAMMERTVRRYQELKERYRAKGGFRSVEPQ